MNVLVDTSVWSLALRRERPVTEDWIHELTELIQEQRVVMIGPVRQELQSGIRDPAQFRKLRDHLRAFPDLPLATVDFEYAAELFNLCRRQRGAGIEHRFFNRCRCRPAQSCHPDNR